MERNQELIGDIFNNMKSEGYLKRAQIFIARKKFEGSSKAFFLMVRSRIKKFERGEESTNNKFVGYEEGDEEYIKERKESLESFLFGSVDEIKQEQAYQKAESDRWVQKIKKYVGNKYENAKKKGIEKAIGDGKVINFLNQMCITVDWEVLE